MRSWVVHYKNKYPGGNVQESDSSINVYSAVGEHVVALRKDGSGSWTDVSEELGLSDRHCLDPLPKEARIFKLQKDGKIGHDELAAERKDISRKLIKNGKIGGVTELKSQGFSFGERLHVLGFPVEQKVSAPVEQKPSANQTSEVAGGEAPQASDGQPAI